MEDNIICSQKRGFPKVFGYLHNSDNSCTGLSLASQFLPSLKDSLENKFSRESNSHRLLVTIVVIIETEVIFVFIHKIDNLRTFFVRVSKAGMLLLRSLIREEDAITKYGNYHIW